MSLLTGKTARGLTLLYASGVIAGMGWSMVLPIIPVFADEFDISGGLAAQIITGFALGRFFGTPVAGWLVDRFGSRIALFGGPLLAAAAAAVSALTPWFAVVIGAAFVVGFGDAVWAFGREIAGIDLVRLEQRGRALSGFHGTHTGGLALGPLIGGIVADTIGFRAVFWAFAIASMVAVLLAFMASNSRPTHAAAPATRTGGSETARRRGPVPIDWWRSLVALFNQIAPALRVTYVLLVFATLASFMFRMTLQSMLPLHADQNAGLSATEIGALFSIAGVLVLALTLPAGFLIDKVGRKWATVPSTALPGVAFLLIPFADSFATLVPLVAIMGVANGLSLGSLATSTYDVVPAAVRGRLQALRRTVAEIGGVSAPLFGGLMANAFNPNVPFLVFAPFLLVAGALLAFAGKETLVKRAPAEEPAEAK